MQMLYVSKGYRRFLSSWLNEQSGVRGLRSRMASELNCQNSHLTRVLREEVHLTMDQAHLATQFLRLGEREADYFMILVEHDRAAEPSYKEKLTRKLKQLKSERENLSSRFEKRELGDTQKEMIYYSSWHWSALHIASMIPRFQTTKKLATRLQLDETFVRRSLKTLAEFGLVTQAGEHWKATRQFLHLPKTSPMNSVQHGNWRSQAVLKTQDRDEDGVHYTVVQSIAESDFEKIKQLVFESIDRYRKLADASSEEEIVCFTCDFFKV